MKKNKTKKFEIKKKKKSKEVHNFQFQTNAPPLYIHSHSHIYKQRFDARESAWFPGMKIRYPLIAYSKIPSTDSPSYAVWASTADVGFADTLNVSVLNV